jgi:site-specific DNA-cytosine methylase
MKVLIACEFSGIVRDAFTAKGHDAWSCDLEPTERPGPHIQGDVLEVLNESWDLLIAHPPCTYLTVTGNKWFKPEFKDRFPTRHKDRIKGIAFFMEFVKANIPKIAIENPIGIMSTEYRKPDQIIQPYQFGDPFQKSTCLWLKGLPKLYHLSTGEFSDKRHTIDHGEMIVYKSGKTCSKWYAMAAKGGIKERQKIRNRTFPGIAQAMAEQWG